MVKSPVLYGQFAGLFVSITVLSGCDQIAGPPAVIQSSRTSNFTPITPEALTTLIVNSYFPSEASSAGAGCNPGPNGGAVTSNCVATFALETAVAAFARNLYVRNQNGTLKPPTKELQMEMRDARNSVLTHLMSASNTLCGDYEESLKEKSSNITFGLGSLAAGFGGAGAIFTNSTASIFSGLAGVTSGVNAEYNKDFFQGLATSIIIPGIEKQRSALAQGIAKKMCYGITTYPLPMAISDAIRFHNSCTMDKGIAATSQSVNQSSAIGLDTLKSTLQQINDIHNMYVHHSGASGSSGGTADESGTTGTTDATGKGTTSGNASSSPKSSSTAQTPLGTEVTLTDCGPLDDNGQLPQASSDSDSTKSSNGSESSTSVSSDSSRLSLPQ